MGNVTDRDPDDAAPVQLWRLCSQEQQDQIADGFWKQLDGGERMILIENLDDANTFIPSERLTSRWKSYRNREVKELYADGKIAEPAGDEYEDQ